jgi:hypothetical protein
VGIKPNVVAEVGLRGERFFIEDKLRRDSRERERERRSYEEKLIY